jgi:hypothetical protein
MIFVETIKSRMPGCRNCDQGSSSEIGGRRGRGIPPRRIRLDFGEMPSVARKFSMVRRNGADGG